MCKYCKKLKEIKNLDEKRYQEIINSWKRRDKRARDIITRLLDIYAYEFNFGEWEDSRSYSDFMESVFNEDKVVDLAVDFLKKDWIGK